jgi:lactate dehydrogenase-like 2-hydroxyacid dehydrogenase
MFRTLCFLVLCCRERIHGAPKLKLILTAGIGSDHIDLHAASDKNITVAECTGDYGPKRLLESRDTQSVLWEGLFAAGQKLLCIVRSIHTACMAQHQGVLNRRL